MRVACTQTSAGLSGASLSDGSVGRIDDDELAEAARERRTQVDARLGELIGLAGDADGRVQDRPPGGPRHLFLSPSSTGDTRATRVQSSGATA